MKQPLGRAREEQLRELFPVNTAVDDDIAYQAVTWCHEHFAETEPDWGICYRPESRTYLFFFKNDHDAVLFKIYCTTRET